MSEEIYTRVVGCLAATTRYPEELFTPDADLEDHLGIDSVKRVEIIITLSEEFGLNLQAEESDASIRTVGDVVGWIGSLLSKENDPSSVQQVQKVELHRNHIKKNVSAEPLVSQVAPATRRPVLVGVSARQLQAF